MESILRRNVLWDYVLGVVAQEPQEVDKKMLHHRKRDLALAHIMATILLACKESILTLRDPTEAGNSI